MHRAIVISAMQTEPFDKTLNDLARLMAERLELRPAPFATLAHKAAPRLPRGLRRQVLLLAEAQVMAQHPRLAVTLDIAALARAVRELSAYLRGIDVADRRHGRRLALAGRIAANLIAVFVLVLAVLIWRGFV